MNAHPILLQKKYARIVNALAEAEGIPPLEALDLFYRSKTYQLMREGISDMHARSDAYLVEELQLEYGLKSHLS